MFVLMPTNDWRRVYSLFVLLDFLLLVKHVLISFSIFPWWLKLYIQWVSNKEKSHATYHQMSVKFEITFMRVGPICMIPPEIIIFHLPPSLFCSGRGPVLMFDQKRSTDQMGCHVIKSKCDFVFNHNWSKIRFLWTLSDQEHSMPMSSINESEQSKYQRDFSKTA